MPGSRSQRGRRKPMRHMRQALSLRRKQRGPTLAWSALFPDRELSMLVAIVDYQSGNLHSAEKAFARAAREAGIAAEIAVTPDPEVVRQADRIVLPGVGAFGDCYTGLNSTAGMIEALNEAVFKHSAPFFGICVGMQLLADRGLEHGSHKGLGWIAGEVDLIVPRDKRLKIPHMGWNTLTLLRDHP